MGMINSKFRLTVISGKRKIWIKIGEEARWLQLYLSHFHFKLSHTDWKSTEKERSVEILDAFG